MAIENASFIDDLVVTNPVGSDDYSTADDHLRLIKSVLKTQFPNLSAVMSASAAELNKLDGLLATQAQLDLLARTKSAIKTADETVNNVAILQDDNELVITGLTAGKIYAIEGLLIYTNASITPGIALQIASVSGASVGFIQAVQSDGFGNMAAESAALGGAIDLATSVAVTPYVIALRGIYNSTTAPGFKLKWAQAVATVSDTTIKTNSFLRAVPLN